MKKTLLSNASILTMDDDRTLLTSGALLLAGDRIEGIGPRDELLKDQTTGIVDVDLRGRWILPGFINTHLHTAQFLARGVADDVDLLTWLHERIFPFDTPATYLLRALSVDDIEEAERLGCLELDEEDLALCTFVCPGKANYATILRRNLDLIEKEG